MSLEMTRRSFLKTLCASLAITAVPALGIKIPDSEPVKWVIERFDYDTTVAVGGIWQNGWHNAVNVAVGIDNALPEDQTIEYCKQALRQWYRDKDKVVRIPLKELRAV